MTLATNFYLLKELFIEGILAHASGLLFKLLSNHILSYVLKLMVVLLNVSR